MGENWGKIEGVAAKCLRETLIGWFGRWGSLYRQVGWLVYANAPGTSLSRPVIAFVTAGGAYELRFGRNFDLRAQLVEPIDHTSLR